MHNILIVEDDNALAQGLRRALDADNVTADACGTIGQARAYLKEKEYELVILDINLPDGSGFDFLAELKKQSCVSVIMLTANDMETDIVTGLEAGAEDYITKPFSLAVLRARVNAQLRRITQNKKSRDIDENGQNTGSEVIGRGERIGEWLFDFAKMEFYYKDEKIELSKTEQRLLRILTENREITLTRDRLIDYVWGLTELVDENALSVCIKRLRDKLHAHDCIQTVYGIGYVWKNPVKNR